MTKLINTSLYYTQTTIYCSPSAPILQTLSCVCRDSIFFN